MAQTYTLDEAADKLNLSVEEFKRRLRTEWTQIRSFRDGATLRFRANEIDELARTYGLGSSDELPLAESSPLDLPDDIALAPKAKARGDSGAPLNLDDSSEEAFVLTPDAPAAPKSKKGDSDVRLEAAERKRKAEADDEESILTEELELPTGGGSAKLSGKSGKLTSEKLRSGDSGKQKAAGKTPKPAAKPAPAADDSSEFELTLDADSDEFELSLTQDSSDEVSLGDMPASTPANKAGQSGINLNRPADSGVSLESKKKDDEEVDFELSLDAPGSGMSSRKGDSGKASKSGKKGAGSDKKKKKPDSDSEFELSLEEPSDSGLDLGPIGDDKKADIFEATDFEIPALDDDSASEAVSLDDSDTDVESSDFDLALDDADADADDESASQVVALDDEDAPAKARKKKKRRAAADDDDDGDVDLDDDAASSLRGVRHGDDSDEYEVSEAAGDLVAAPAQWGPWPAVLMFPTLIVLFLGTIMAYEVLHSMWGYQQTNQPGTPLVNFVAEKFDMKPAQ